MNFTYLDYFDQFRFMGGTIFAELIFIVHAIPKRKNFRSRSVLGFILCILLSLTYLPLIEYFMAEYAFAVVSTFSFIWWLLASLVTIAYILFCYELTAVHAIYRCIMGLALQQIITVAVRYCIAGIWFPGLPENYPLLYTGITLATYLFFYLLGYHLVAKKMQTSDHLYFLNSRKILWSYVLLILIYSTFSNVTIGIFEWVLAPLALFEELLSTKTILQYFCIGVILFISIVIFLIQYNVYEISFLRLEAETLKQLQVEKEKQYIFSKENINLMNQKSHDLKHFLQALKMADYSEREKLIEDTNEVVQFYDSIIKTDSEVLNTILTEKSLLCTKYNIKLTCSLSTTKLSELAVVDLYTMLGNAIDNAIECVKEYNELEKRIISVSILERGNVLCIFVDNYFEGTLEYEDGIPLTSKKDNAYHGYGVKSIKMLARKYGGDIRISDINHSFSLQIMIPI